MKITTFNPQIITKDAEPLVKLFEELGFEKRHRKEGIGESDITDIRMKDSSSFYVDIAEIHAPIPCDMVSKRMNVDNFDEAYEVLSQHGFKKSSKAGNTYTPTSRSSVLVSPTGFTIRTCSHSL